MRSPAPPLRRRALALALLALAAAPGCRTAGDGGAEGATGSRVGALVVVGGGGTPDEALRVALALAAGPRTRVAILPQASEREDRGQGSAELWLAAGAAEARVIDPLDDAGARAGLERADLIWMSGGDQARLVAALREAGLDELVRRRHRAGAVVGGTSAGAAAMSAVMITGESYELESVRAATTDVAPGLGLWPGAIVDQHFLARRRMARLVSAVLDRPDLVGVGIDERTAVVVRGDRIEVVGEGAVVMLDAADARVSASELGGLHAALGIRMHLLRPGDTLRAGAIARTPPSPLSSRHDPGSPPAIPSARSSR
jgi:cyanophycinase